MEQRRVQEYKIPKTMGEALQVLSEEKRKLCIIAGATDVYVGENNGVEVYLDISRIGLSYIERREESVVVGATVTFDELIRSDLIREEAACLWEASRQLADKTIRNVATIGGNICTAVPSGDSLTPLLALDARFVLISKEGERTIPAEEFFEGVRKTKIRKDEILKEIVFPIRKKGEQSVFMKQGRNSEDIAILNVAVRILLDEENVIKDLRIANGAVAPTPVRAYELEKALEGQKFSEELIQEHISKLEENISPITNVRGTAEYRMSVSKVFTRRALLQAYKEIKEN